MYKTIQGAIDAASDGEMVIVMPGTYRENVRLRGNNITVQSSDPDDDSVINSTIIRGKEYEGKEYDTPTIIVAEGSRSTLAGFKILGQHHQAVITAARARVYTNHPQQPH